jgi:hypothetical protein
MNEVEEFAKYYRYMQDGTPLWAIYSYANEEVVVETKITRLKFDGYVDGITPALLSCEFEGIPLEAPSTSRIYETKEKAIGDYLKLQAESKLQKGAVTRMLVSLLSQQYPELTV